MCNRPPTAMPYRIAHGVESKMQSHARDAGPPYAVRAVTRSTLEPVRIAGRR